MLTFDIHAFDVELARCISARFGWKTVSRRRRPRLRDDQSIVSDATSCVSLRLTYHANDRMDERAITGHVLRRTLKYGSRHPNRDGRDRLEWRGVSVIVDNITQSTVTIFRSYKPPPLPTLWECISAQKAYQFQPPN